MITGPTYFLGANSPKGFFSHYGWIINLDDARDVYILKGGPGCGKSSFMRRIADRAADKGVGVEYISCSSDSDSLDGLIIPSLKTAVVDGTAPHVRST